MIWQACIAITSYNNCADNNEEALTSQGTKRRILVVDDKPDITTTLQIGLEAGRFDVDVFTDPELAPKKVKFSIFSSSELAF